MSAQVTVQPGEQIVRIDVKSLRRGSWKWQDYLGVLRGFEIVAHPQDNYYPHPPVKDGRLALFSLTARNYVAARDELPYDGKAVWLSQYRPNHRFRLQELGGDLYNPPQRYRLTRPTFKDREAPAGQGEAFRTSTERRITAPLFAIIAAPADEPQARLMQDYLARMFRVKLPVNPEGMAASPDQGNVVFIGRSAALDAGRITRAELRGLADDEGFVIRARDGAVAIAGNRREGTAYGIAAYLRTNGARFFIPGSLEAVPDLSNGFLEETVFFDWPYFPRRTVPGGWKLGTQRPAPTSGLPILCDVGVAETMAERIKDLARTGRPVGEEVLKPAAESALAAYVAGRLLWDPFADTTYIIGEFRAGCVPGR